MRIFLIFMMTLGVFLAAGPARADTITDIAVAVRARGGTFIGNAVGGAQVTVTDLRTGDIIASGLTHGVSGTMEQMQKPVMVDGDTADLQFSLELVEPTPVRVTATGPMAQPQSRASVSEDMVLIPGKDYTAGNGILLELPGLAVDILEPGAGTRVAHNPEETFKLTANVVNMAGDPVEEGSSWPPENLQVEAYLYKDGMYLMTAPLKYSGKPGVFEQMLKMPDPGIYKIMVGAFNPQTKEAGTDTTTLILTSVKGKS